MDTVVVDPSRTVLKCVGRLLEARDHQVFPFQDAPEALDYISAHTNVGVLLTSAELTSMSGAEMCLKVRRLAGKRRPIYILMMSASHERHNLVEAIDGGADDFINKPPNAEELYARLRAAERLGTLQRDLICMATLDPLTGISNRRGFFEAAAEYFSPSVVGPIAAIMIDIDHFKGINDTFGHDVGDEAIRCVAALAASEEAITGRLGGEEFAMLLPGKTADDAVALAERLRVRVTDLSISAGQGRISLTSSFGVSAYQIGDNIDTLLRRADMALYMAKSGGRNRVVSSSDVEAAHALDRTGSVIRGQARDIKTRD
ncbi:MAG: diguanylate cyclase [Pseudorhodoplanes sp.]|jgi:diguanylate cyclase (GGDEF)-like protein|nr:diguanylate cyclase [Pseudorhodoplanes sp.]